MKSKISDSQKKSIKRIILSILLILVIIVAYFELNIFINKLNISDIDCTEQQLYSLTDESKEKIKDISDEVKIELINFENYTATSRVSDIESLMNKYSKANSNIIIEKTTDEEDSDPMVRVTCNDNELEIYVDDLYSEVFSSDTYNYEDYDICEEKITNAILNVTNSSDKKIYFYLTHSAYNSAYFSTVINNFFNINYINSTDISAILDDCSCLVIPTVVEDITDDEKTVLLNYINNGGNILLLQESKTLINIDLPNFKEVTDQFGFEVSEGVILDSNEDDIIKNKPGYILTNYNIDDKANGKICMIEPGTIIFKSDDELSNLGVTYKAISCASDTAFLRTDTSITSYEKDENDTDASGAILSAIINKKVSEDKESKLIVYANSIFATNQALTISDVLTNQSYKIYAVSLNDNENMMINSINYLAGDDSAVFIRKSLYENIRTMNLLKNSFAVETLFVVPLIIIFAGYVVWRIRKNKK